VYVDESGRPFRRRFPGCSLGGWKRQCEVGRYLCHPKISKVCNLHVGQPGGGGLCIGGSPEVLVLDSIATGVGDLDLPRDG
jgi:hypothetical protein